MDSIKFFAIFFVVFLISGIQSTLYKTPNNVTYYIEATQTFTWYDGLIECNKRGMALVSLNSKEKFADLHALPLVSTSSFWTSANGNNNNYAWMTTGRSLIPSLWCPSQPKSSGNCVKVSSQCYGLENELCDSTAGFVCEERVKPGHCCENESTVLNIMQNDTCKNIP